MEHPIDSYGKGRFTFASGGELAFQLQVQQAAMPINNVANLYSVSPFWREAEQRELAQISISKGRVPIYIGGNLAKRRSEERRVGKECRSRWSPYHSKKKEKIEERREG